VTRVQEALPEPGVTRVQEALPEPGVTRVEQEALEEPDAWAPGKRGWSGGGVPVAGGPEADGSTAAAWAPTGWAPPQEPVAQEPVGQAPPQQAPPQQASVYQAPVHPAPVRQPTGQQATFRPEYAQPSAPTFTPSSGLGRDGGVLPDSSWPPRVPQQSFRFQLVVSIAAFVVLAIVGIVVALVIS
jgi:hypothetical protein